MDEILHVRTSHDESVGSVLLKGVLDLSTLDAFATAVCDLAVGSVNTIRIDATELTFCDSSALNTLIGIKRAAAAEGRRLAVVNLARHLEDLWMILGVYDYLTDSGEHTAQARHRSDAPGQVGHGEIRLDLAQGRAPGRWMYNGRPWIGPHGGPSRTH